MKKYQTLFVVLTVVVSIAASIVAVIVKPEDFLKILFPVLLVWLICFGLGWIGLIVMAAKCDLSRMELLSRNKKAREGVMVAMDSRVFWISFWGSLVALIVNTVVPLALLFVVAYSIWTVLFIEVLNVCQNLFAIPFRKWIWGIRREHRASLLINQEAK